MHSVPRRIAAIATAAALSCGLAGCGGTPSVSKSKLAGEIKTLLTQRGADVGTVTCHQNLEAKVGATSACDATISGTKQKMVATVESVSGRTVHYTVVQG